MPCVPMLSSLRIIVIQVRVVPDLILVLLVARVAESVAAYHRVTHIQNTSCFVHWRRTVPFDHHIQIVYCSSLPSFVAASASAAKRRRSRCSRPSVCVLPVGSSDSAHHMRSHLNKLVSSFFLLFLSSLSFFLSFFLLFLSFFL